MVPYFTDLPDWVKLLGPPALWTVFLVSLLWVILKTIVPLMFPQRTLIDFFTQHPGYGVAILLPLATSPIVLLAIIIINITLQTFLPQLEYIRELKAYRQSLPGIKSDISELRSNIESEISSLQKGVSIENIVYKTGKTVKIVSKSDNAAAVECDAGFVAIGGACSGNPWVVAHPMTSIGGIDNRSFSCNFYVDTTDSNIRTITPTAVCLRVTRKAVR